MAMRVPPAMSPRLSSSMAEVEDEEIEESLDSDSVSEDAEEEGPTAEDEDPAMWDEGLAAGDEVPESDGLDLGEEEEAVPEGQQRAVPVVGTVVSAPLRLGYGALRRRELALEEDHVYSTFEVGQGSRSAPEPERLERVSAFRQPTLTTWTDPKDGIVYIDVPAYPPPAPRAQIPPSPEWSSGSQPISPSPSIVSSPISSPMIPLIVPSPVATPATAETEGFLTKLGAQVEMQGDGFVIIRDEIFSQRYWFKSLEHEQKRVAMTFGALWRPVLALESWASQMDAQRAAL
ncbi:hypothetical protein Tco_1386376 [Tanacetum coccineum]